MFCSVVSLTFACTVLSSLALFQEEINRSRYFNRHVPDGYSKLASLDTDSSNLSFKR